MAGKKVLVGELRLVVSHAPYIPLRPGSWLDNKRIHAPTVIDSVRRLQRLSGSLADTRVPARCYEAMFVGNDAGYGAPIYEAVRRLRVSILDMAEVEAGSAPDIDDVIRFLAGDTPELEIAPTSQPRP